MPVSVRCKCGHVFSADAGGTEVVCPACGKRGSTKGARANSYDVFLSYASPDKATADAACAALENSGLRCWIAPRNIVPGAEWSEAIIDGVDRSRSLVLILTEHSNNSQQVLREVKHAVDRDIPLLPLRLQDVPVSKSLGYFISCHHWLDAFIGPLEQHLPALKVAVRQLLAGQTVAAPTKTDEKVATAHSARQRVFVVVTMALVPVIAYIAWSLWPKERPLVGKASATDNTVSDVVGTKKSMSFEDPFVPGYVEMMKKRFGTLDRDHNMRLEKSEFGPLKAADGAAFSAIKAERGGRKSRFVLLDTNDDGWIDLPEFLGTCRQIVVARDQDGDGRLSESEFSAEDASLPAVHQRPDVRYPFAQYDFNADGDVTLLELEQAWTLFAN